jgi:hypothetical protein
MTDHTKGTETNINLSKQSSKDDKLGLPRKENQKTHVRDNANYLCTVCKAKFFTKVEVEEHFFKHPLA